MSEGTEHCNLNPKVEGVQELVSMDRQTPVKNLKQELKTSLTTLNTFLNEFKKYIDSSHIVDNSIAMVIGQSFTELMNSFVLDLVVPVFSLLLGKPDVTKWFLVLRRGRSYRLNYKSVKEAKLDGAGLFLYGKFFQKIINFMFLGLTLTMFAKVSRKVLFYKLITKKEKEELEKKEKLKGCTFCFQMIDKRATRCSHCTAKLD